MFTTATRRAHSPLKTIEQAAPSRRGARRQLTGGYEEQAAALRPGANGYAAQSQALMFRQRAGAAAESPRQREFALRVTGGGRMMAPFFTECMERFKGCTMYDSSSKISAFREREAALGMTDYASPQWRRLAEQIRKDQRAGAAADVLVDFHDDPNTGVLRVTISGPKRTIVLQWTKAEYAAHLQKMGLDRMCDPLLDAVAAAL